MAQGFTGLLDIDDPVTSPVTTGMVDTPAVRRLLSHDESKEIWANIRVSADDERREINTQLREFCETYVQVAWEIQQAQEMAGFDQHDPEQWPEGPIQYAEGNTFEALLNSMDGMSFGREIDEETGKPMKHQHQVTKQLNSRLSLALFKNVKTHGKGNPVTMAVMASKDDKQAHQVLSSLPFRGNQLHDEEFLAHAQQSTTDMPTQPHQHAHHGRKGQRRSR